jgi:hypothetical protein
MRYLTAIVDGRLHTLTTGPTDPSFLDSIAGFPVPTGVAYIDIAEFTV